jgi:hypothetical protein
MLPAFENHTSELEHVKQMTSYNDHIQSLYHRLENVRNENDRNRLVTTIKLELGTAQRVKESPSEYFKDPEQRAVAMKGMNKYISDLEKLESKASHYIIHKPQ